MSPSFEMSLSRVEIGGMDATDYVRSGEMTPAEEDPADNIVVPWAPTFTLHFDNSDVRFAPTAERLGWAPRPSLSPGTDILELIDDAVGERCACGCGTPIGPDSESVWYATPECQRRYLERDTDRPHEVRNQPDAALVYPGSDQARWRPETEQGEGLATGGLVADWVVDYELTSWQRRVLDCAMGSGNAYALFGHPRSNHAYSIGLDMEATDWSRGHSFDRVWFDEVTVARIFRVPAHLVRARDPKLRRLHTETSRRQRARRRRR